MFVSGIVRRSEEGNYSHPPTSLSQDIVGPLPQPVNETGEFGPRGEAHVVDAQSDLGCQ